MSSCEDMKSPPLDGLLGCGEGGSVLNGRGKLNSLIYMDCYSNNLFLCYSNNLFLCYSNNLFLPYSNNLFLRYSNNLFLCYSNNLFLCYSNNLLAPVLRGSIFHSVKLAGIHLPRSTFHREKWAGVHFQSGKWTPAHFSLWGPFFTGVHLPRGSI